MVGLEVDLIKESRREGLTSPFPGSSSKQDCHHRA